MAEVRRFVNVHFMDGSKISISFEKQVSNEVVATRLREALNSTHFTFEADGDMFVIPMTSIKYLQMHPAPAKLPDNVIRGARIIAATT